jgi:AcrR family transcriptional regulator
MPTKQQPAKQPAAEAGAAAPVRRLRRAERRDQLLAAATQAFARAGFAATSLDDVAAAAGISRAILYRHFESKTDLYRAVLDRAVARLAAAVGTRDYTYASIDALLGAAAEDPDGFGCCSTTPPGNRSSARRWTGSTGAWWPPPAVSSPG